MKHSTESDSKSNSNWNSQTQVSKWKSEQWTGTF